MRIPPFCGGPGAGVFCATALRHRVVEPTIVSNVHEFPDTFAVTSVESEHRVRLMKEDELIGGLILNSPIMARFGWICIQRLE